MTAKHSACLWSSMSTPVSARPSMSGASSTAGRCCIVPGKLFVRHGAPEHIRSDNGPEFVAAAVRDWLAGLAGLNVKTLYIEPGSPWENGYCESFDGKPRDECLNREIFTTLTQAQILIEQWRRFYNTERPHSSPCYRPPAPETVLPRRPTIPYAATLISQTADWTVVGFQLKGRITRKTPHKALTKQASPRSGSCVRHRRSPQAPHRSPPGPWHSGTYISRRR